MLMLLLHLLPVSSASAPILSAAATAVPGHSAVVTPAAIAASDANVNKLSLMQRRQSPNPPIRTLLTTEQKKKSRTLDNSYI